MSAAQCGFVTSLMALERLGEGSGQQRQAGSWLLPAPFRDLGANYRPEGCTCQVGFANPRSSSDPVDIL